MYAPIFNGCGMQTEEAYSSGHLALSNIVTSMCSNVRPISPELVLFLDFWVSNIPRSFCFTLDWI